MPVYERNRDAKRSHVVQQQLHQVQHSMPQRERYSSQLLQYAHQARQEQTSYGIARERCAISATASMLLNLQCWRCAVRGWSDSSTTVVQYIVLDLVARGVVRYIMFRHEHTLYTSFDPSFEEWGVLDSLIEPRFIPPSNILTRRAYGLEGTIGIEVQKRRI